MEKKVHVCEGDHAIVSTHILVVALIFMDMCSSTRIKDAGVAIRHSRGRILFYTAGSSNELEGIGGGGCTYKIIKKESNSLERGSQLSKPGKNNKKCLTRQIHIQITLF